jgi:hypothetical protein
MVGEHGDVICTSRLYLQHEGPHGSISTEGESSSMVEDALAIAEHGHQRHVMGTVRGTVLREVSFRGHTVPEYEACFMEMLRYAPHLNTEKLKVNRFVFGLNGNLHAKFRVLMPQTLHDAIQKAFIAEEELISGGQTRTLARPVG